MNEEIHDRFYEAKHYDSTQLVERYHCEGNGALCDMDCENCELYKKYYTKEPCPYCHDEQALLCKANGLSIRIWEGDLLIDHDGDELVIHDDVRLNYCPMCGRKLEDV